MAKPTKRCHYEVLGVSRDAAADEIRSTFRQLALQMHPDKQAASGVSIADVTVAFQELLEAYKVLSDAKERDWYDTHRRTSETRSSHLSRASIIDISGFFVSSCFSGYSESGKGFFKIYGEVFSEIYSQELYFARNLGLGLDPAPPIGNVYSAYAQFMAFYNYWLGFSTLIDFDWIDHENDKEEAVNSRNWMVRDLAAFVKKMDKRLVPGKESEEHEKIREKVRAKKKEKAKRRKEENLKFGNNLKMNQIPQNQEDGDDDDDDEVVYEKEKVKACKKEEKKKKKENVTDKMKRRAKRKAKRMEKKMEKEETMKKIQSVCNEIDDDDDDKKKKKKFWLMKMKMKKKNNNKRRRKKVMYEGVEDDGDDDMVKEEEKKEKGFGRVYCMECKKYFRFHEHMKTKSSSSKKVVGGGKWDASKPLILVFQIVVEANPRKSYQYRFFDKHRRGGQTQ